MKYVFSYFDLWPYLLISFFFLILNTLKFEKSSFYIFFCLLLFSSLRYDVGWDYTSYLEELDKGYLYLLNSRFEFFSKTFFLIGSLFDFYPIFFFLFSFFTLILIHLSILKNSKNHLISWLVFYSMPLFFFASLSTIRQSLATALLLYSYNYLSKKKYLRGIVIIFTATLFHYSAILGILLIPLILIPFNLFLLWCLFISSFLVSSFLQNHLFNLDSQSEIIIRFIDKYLDNDLQKSKLLPYLYYLIISISLLFYNKLVKVNVENKIIIQITIFGIFIFNVFSFEPVTSMRISAFFLIFWIYLIPDFLNLFKRIYKSFFNWMLVITLLFISFVYLFIYINSYQKNILEKISFLPYKFWLFNL